MFTTLDACIDYFRKNRDLFLITLFSGCIVYGYVLTNYSMTIDEEFALLHGVVEGFLGQGRWGISLMKWMFRSDTILPFIAPFLSIVLLSLTALLLQRILHLTGTGKYVFCILYVSFPQFSNMMRWNFLCVGVALGILFTILGYNYFLMSLDRNKENIIFSIALICFGMGFYQSIIFVPATLFLVHHLGLLLRNEIKFNNIFRNGLYFSLVCILSIVMYSLIYIMTLYFKNIDFSEYILGYIAGSGNMVSDRLYHSIFYFRDIYYGNLFMGNKIFVSIWIAIVTLIIYYYAVLRYSQRITFICTLIGCLLVPFLCYVIFSYVPVRVIVAQPLLFAGLWAYATELGTQKIKYAVVGFSLFCVLASSIAVTRLFFADMRAFEVAKMLGTQVAMRIYDAKPDFAAATDGVYFAGNYPEPIHNLSRRGQFGSMAFSVSNADKWIPAFMEAVGLGKFPKVDLSERHTQILRSMPSWPNPASVQAVENVVLVKFSD